VAVRVGDTWLLLLRMVLSVKCAEGALTGKGPKFMMATTLTCARQLTTRRIHILWRSTGLISPLGSYHVLPITL